MGIISTGQLSKTSDTGAKRIISETLKKRLLETVTTCDGAGVPVKKTVAQAIGDKLVDIALFSESEKCSTTAAKLILEYTEGKPAVQDTTVKSEIPAVVFNLTPPLAHDLEGKALVKIQDADVEDQTISFKTDDGEEITL